MIGRRLFFLCAGIAALALILFLTYSVLLAKPKIVYVESTIVFERFNMVLEMKKEGEKELRQRITKVDSLHILLNTPTQSSAEQEQLAQRFIEEKNKLEAFQEQFANVESGKIRDRIASYARDFAKENGYELVLASQPNVNILYGENSLDVTDEFVIYINKKYEGFN